MAGAGPMMAGLMPLVIDSSVVVKLLVEEAGSTEAFAILDRQEKRIAPDSLAVEVAGALWNKVKYSALLAVHAERSLESFPQFLHRLVPCQPLLLDSFRLSVRLQHPVYDCMYLALAISESSRLVTADKKFHAAVRQGKLDDHVELLEWVE